LVYAFGAEEHKLICNAAFSLADIKTQQFINAIIDASDRVIVTDFSRSNARTQVTDFADGCVWPDHVRKTTHHETAQYHYMNIPKGADFNHQRDCIRFDCITQAIQRYALDLNDENVSSTARKEALFFLSHFVADIHQPLHVGYGEDRGGNTITILISTNKTTKTSLHWLWDHHLPQHAGLKSIDHLLNGLTKKSIQKWQQTKPIAWAKESYQLVKNNVYIMPSGRHIQSNTVISEAYLTQNDSLIRQRFKQAAVRLANMLDLAAKGQLTAAWFKAN
jgi:hypothetical protein